MSNELSRGKGLSLGIVAYSAIYTFLGSAAVGEGFEGFKPLHKAKQ